MLVRIRERIALDASPPARIKWFRVSAAAALITVLATGAWFFILRKNSGQPPIAAQKSAPPAQADVLPGSNKPLPPRAMVPPFAWNSQNPANWPRRGTPGGRNRGTGHLRKKLVQANPTL